jgi:hypothetical protein
LAAGRLTLGAIGLRCLVGWFPAALCNRLAVMRNCYTGGSRAGINRNHAKAMAIRQGTTRLHNHHAVRIAGKTASLTGFKRQTACAANRFAVQIKIKYIRARPPPVIKRYINRQPVHTPYLGASSLRLRWTCHQQQYSKKTQQHNNASSGVIAPDDRNHELHFLPSLPIWLALSADKGGYVNFGDHAFLADHRILHLNRPFRIWSSGIPPLSTNPYSCFIITQINLRQRNLSRSAFRSHVKGSSGQSACLIPDPPDSKA